MGKTLEAAARKLLRLKDLHDRIERHDFATWDGYTGAVDDYHTNKPKAWDELRAALATDDGAVMVQHGVSCKKEPHCASTGYLHTEADDSPYYVDGVKYCGRCHVYLEPTDDR